MVYEWAYFLWMGLWMGFLRLKNMLISQKVGFFVKKNEAECLLFTSVYCLIQHIFVVIQRWRSYNTLKAKILKKFNGISKGFNFLRQKPGLLSKRNCSKRFPAINVNVWHSTLWHGQSIVDKFIKLRKISFLLECFTADFGKFSTITASSSIPSLSEFSWNFLI